MNTVNRTPSRALIVEGKNDKHVVKHICKKAGRCPQFDIEVGGDVESVIAAFPAQIKAPHRQAVGIVVDADADLDRRWAEIFKCLLAEGIEIPSSPEPEGTVIEGEPRVGVWLMPDNRSSGEIEDFVQRMIPANDPVWPLSQRYVAGIPPDAREFPEHKNTKAELYAWLATRQAPGPMGLAIAKHDLVIDGELCRQFIGWLERLFG